MGNCIGKRNRMIFMFCIVFTTVFLSHMAVLSLCKLHDEIIIRPKTVYRSLYLVFFALVYSASGCFSIFLVFFHFYIIFSQLTTIEFLTNKYKTEKNPFDQGCLRNFSDFLCRNRREKPIDLKYLIKIEKQEETDTTTNV